MIDSYGQHAPFRVGNHVLYSKVDLPFYCDVSLGNATRYTIGMFKTHKGVFVGIERKGAFTFPFNYELYYGYVMEKLNIASPSDAHSVTDFLNCALGTFTANSSNQNYKPEYVLKGPKE